MKQRVISFYYTLTDAAGKVLDSSKDGEAFSFIEGTGQIIPGLEKELMELKIGDKKKITVPAAEAYGTRDESRIVKVPRQELPSQDLKLGDRFKGGPEDNAPIFVVTQLAETEVTLDGNHPLAGMDLTFDVELVGTREATADELSHGHAHGEHGHSH
jgi:FKBP-type peptidyl-prolyl cis-trans isomerase SlyD